MNNYVVRGPNWKIYIDLSEQFDNVDYEYYEAATRAIELIYSGKIETNDEQNPRFSIVLQVSTVNDDLEISIDSTEEEMEEALLTINEHINNGLIRFISTPLILANAGRYSQAEFLKTYIEENSN